MMKTVHRYNVLPKKAVSNGIIFQFHGVGRRRIQIPLAMVDVGVGLVGKILIKRSTAENVERLMSEADAENRDLALKASSRR